MIQLFIIADDFTGALDTGVQLVKQGLPSHVTIGGFPDLKQLPPQTRVLVIDAETRHLSAKNAYDTVSLLVSQAVKAGIRYIYKKTDSCLRGNIGAELSAVLESSHQSHLHFIPAFPQMNRVTKDGTQYISGIPVAESPFGKDPFDPVSDSYIPDLIHNQTDTQVRLISACNEPGCSSDPEFSFPGSESGKPEILLYDACTETDLTRIEQMLPHSPEGILLAGCAGFASHLAHMFHLAPQKTMKISVPSHLLIACGSIHPVSLSQCEYAVSQGAPCFSMPEAYLTDPGCPACKSWTAQLADACHQNQLVVLNTCNQGSSEIRPENRLQVQSAFGQLIRKMLDQQIPSTIFIMGGDSLMGMMQALGVTSITPVKELAPGVVLSYFSYRGIKYPLISKSGGFGEPDLFCRIQQMLQAAE